LYVVLSIYSIIWQNYYDDFAFFKGYSAIEKSPWSIVVIVHTTDGIGFFLFSIMLVLDWHRATSAPPTTPLPYPSRRTQASFSVALFGEFMLFTRHWLKAADPSVEKHMHGLYSIVVLIAAGLILARLIWPYSRDLHVTASAALLIRGLYNIFAGTALFSWNWSDSSDEMVHERITYAWIYLVWIIFGVAFVGGIVSELPQFGCTPYGVCASGSVFGRRFGGGDRVSDGSGDDVPLFAGSDDDDDGGNAGSDDDGGGGDNAGSTSGREGGAGGDEEGGDDGLLIISRRRSVTGVN
jgi:hypothetical protein